MHSKSCRRQAAHKKVQMEEQEDQGNIHTYAQECGATQQKKLESMDDVFVLESE